MARIPIMAFFARQAQILRDQGVTLDGGITLTGSVLHNGTSQERIALRTTASGLSGRMRAVRPFELSPTGGKIKFSPTSS